MPSGRARVAGVMGWPVGHSRSPRLHGYWLEHYQLDGAYVPLAVRPEDFATAFRALPQLGFAGVNVTIPHKEAACALVDACDPLAQRIGAVNTVVIEDGRLIGSTTDGYGFLENLREGAPDWRADTGPAVVLGAGGTARAVVAALLDEGAPAVRLANRTRERAVLLAQELGGSIDVVAWDARAEALEGAALLVNTTSLGMTGADPLDIALTALPAGAVVTDLVYAPLETALLRQAKGHGYQCVNGLGTLLQQGRPGFAAWFGVDPAVTPELRRFVLDDRV